LFWKNGCLTFQFIPDQASNKQGYPKFQPVMTEKRECLLAYTHNLYQRERSILKHWGAQRVGCQAQTHICSLTLCSSLSLKNSLSVAFG